MLDKGKENMRTRQGKKYMRAGAGDGNYKDWTRGYWTREGKRRT
jgi:hypothetical protein